MTEHAYCGEKDLKISKLESRLFLAVAMLREDEWPIYNPKMDDLRCRYCENGKKAGHRADCRLKAVLEG